MDSYIEVNGICPTIEFRLFQGSITTYSSLVIRIGLVTGRETVIEHPKPLNPSGYLSKSDKIRQNPTKSDKIRQTSTVSLGNDPVESLDGALVIAR